MGLFHKFSVQAKASLLKPLPHLFRPFRNPGEHNTPIQEITLGKFTLFLLLAIGAGGVGFLMLAYRFFRPAEPEAKHPCPGCREDGRLLRQEQSGQETIRLHYYCQCGNVWPVTWQLRVPSSSEFNPKMN